MNRSDHMTVSVIIPAFNEAECIALVLADVFALKKGNSAAFFDEIIVVDNASTDGTGEIALACGATVIHEEKSGYGQACWSGVQASNADIVLFLDGDGSANIADAINLVAAIHAGASLAIGVRLKMERGAMTFPQRFGNALACSLIRHLWKISVNDLGPFRAITRVLFDDIHMQDRGFGWTVEMQVRANRLQANVVDIPVTWKNRIGGQSKISGTVSGVFFAGIGILKMIATLWWRDKSCAYTQPAYLVKHPL